LNSGSCKTCSTGCSACGSDGKCTTCASGYILDNGACTACSKGCTECGTDGKCTKCDTGYVLDTNACKACATGCTECSTDGKCTACDYNYSFLNDACTACSSGTYVDTGKKLAADCKACDSGYFYLTSTHTCTKCDDDNCVACSGAKIGHCTTCATDFTLLPSGTCKDKNTKTEAKTGSSSGNIRFDMDLDTFNSYGGANYFIASTAKALGISPDLIQVSGTKIGSVIVLFTIFSTGTVTPAQITQQINNAVANGQMSLYGNEVIVMDSSAVVLLPDGCPSGQYYDAANYECKDCTDDTCGKKKSKHLGAILEVFWEEQLWSFSLSSSSLRKMPY